jgi:hypothetical protein
MPKAAEHFCWIKTVILMPREGASIPAPDGGMHPAIAQYTTSPADTPMRPPPDPQSMKDGNMGDAHRGTGTNPPNSNQRIRYDAASLEGESLPSHYWQAEHHAALVDLPVTGCTAIAIQPVAGERVDALKWRERHPEWFADAVSVSLINFTQGVTSSSSMSGEGNV